MVCRRTLEPHAPALGLRLPTRRAVHVAGLMVELRNIGHTTIDPQPVMIVYKPDQYFFAVRRMREAADPGG